MRKGSVAWQRIPFCGKTGDERRGCEIPTMGLVRGGSGSSEGAFVRLGRVNPVGWEGMPLKLPKWVYGRRGFEISPAGSVSAGSGSPLDSHSLPARSNLLCSCCKAKRSEPLSSDLPKKWWSIGDSNPWPFECHSNALPTAPMPHIQLCRSLTTKCIISEKCSHVNTFCGEICGIPGSFL